MKASLCLANPQINYRFVVDVTYDEVTNTRDVSYLSVTIVNVTSVQHDCGKRCHLFKTAKHPVVGLTVLHCSTPLNSRHDVIII